jgi:hypothetical protein
MEETNLRTQETIAQLLKLQRQSEAAIARLDIRAIIRTTRASIDVTVALDPAATILVILELVDQLNAAQEKLREREPQSKPKPGYITGTKQMLFNVHAKETCRGWCVIHNPMPGPWDEWPTHWRDDMGIMERLCPHGIGHPAAEELVNSFSIGVHPCDGCPCSLPDLEPMATHTGFYG